MATVTLTDPENGQTTDANVIANNNSALETCLNGGVDNTNISASAAISVSKLAAGANGTRLQVVSGVPTWVAFVGARVFHNAAQSIANATHTAVAFNSERFDTNEIHDTATNNTRLTCKTAGKYLIGGTLEYAANASGIFRIAAIRLNGATFISSGKETFPTGGLAHLVSAETQTLYDLAVNDYVELMAYQDTGGALNVNASGNYSPEFWMYRVD